jgi:type IV pilus assembly protein PilV
MSPANFPRNTPRRVREMVSMGRHVRGVSLVEVLVSVVVLSIGLLGVAAMQSIALRGGQSSLESSQAVIQTASIIEAIRANKAGSYNGTYNAVPAATASSSLAQKDLNEWIAGMRGVANWQGVTLTPAIVSGDAQATISGCPATCVITVQWNDQRGGGSTTRAIRTEASI